MSIIITEPQTGLIDLILCGIMTAIAVAILGYVIFISVRKLIIRRFSENE